MSKQYYFSVCVEEDGTAWIDSEHQVRFNSEDVWDSETESWIDRFDDDVYDSAEEAFRKLSEILNQPNRKGDK